MTDFYNYYYLDPRKPGKYQYEGLDFCFLFEPFYVGKGEKTRCQYHIKLAQRENAHDTNRLKINKIKKILSCGFEPFVEMIKRENEQDAFSNEIKHVALIGRIDLGTGPLTNLTEGGEGGHPGPKTRIKQRKAKLGRKASAETRKKMREASLGKKNHFFGKKHTQETLEKISQNRKGKMCGKDHFAFGKKMKASSRKKMSEAKKKLVGEKNHRSKRYEVISPTGETFIFCGNFYGNCIKIGFKSPQFLRYVAQGKINDWKGWKCRYLDTNPVSEKNELGEGVILGKNLA